MHEFTFNWTTGVILSGGARHAPVRWLCWVCCRAFTGGSVPWASRACSPCWIINERAAELFGAESVWPFGMYSLMNGVGIRFRRRDVVRDAQIKRFHRQVRAMDSMVDTLKEWSAAERKRMGKRAGLTDSRVGIFWWEVRFPASPRASASAYSRLTRTHLPALVEIDPRVADIAWLSEAAVRTS